MNIFLFGASGPTGLLVLQYLIEKKYFVKALVRSPEKIEMYKNNNLEIIKGDVFREETYSESLKNCDMVISILGFGKSMKSNNIYSSGGQIIIKVMQKSGVKKFLTVTSNGLQKDDPAIQKSSWLYKYIGLWLAREIYADMRKLEELLENTDEINWIIVRPPKLTNGRLTKNYQVANIYSPGGIEISRADLANFIVDQITSDKYIFKKPVLAYKLD